MSNSGNLNTGTNGRQTATSQKTTKTSSSTTTTTAAAKTTTSSSSAVGKQATALRKTPAAATTTTSMPVNQQKNNVTPQQQLQHHHNQHNDNDVHNKKALITNIKSGSGAGAGSGSGSGSGSGKMTTTTSAMTTATAAATMTTTSSINLNNHNNHHPHPHPQHQHHHNPNNQNNGGSQIKPALVTKSNITNINQTHRRDNSYLSGHRDARKFKYLKPQTKDLISPANDNGIVDIACGLLPTLALMQQTDSQTTTTTSTSSISSINKTNNEKNNDSDNRDMLLVYYDNELVSASLEALILHMVPTHDYYPEHNFLFSFILSARLFIRPHELLARISKTWEQQQQEQQQQQQQQQQQKDLNHSEDVVDDAQHHLNHQTLYSHTHSNNLPSNLNCNSNSHSNSNSNSNSTSNANAAPSHAHNLNSASPLQQRKLQYNDLQLLAIPIHKLNRTSIQRSAQNCIKLLSDWIDTFPYDFRDERLMQQVRILSRKCVYIDNSLGKQVSRILQLLVSRLTDLEKYEEFLQSLLNMDLIYNHASISSNNLLQHYSTSASAAYHSMLMNATNQAAAHQQHNLNSLANNQTTAAMSAATTTNTHANSSYGSQSHESHHQHHHHKLLNFNSNNSQNHHHHQHQHQQHGSILVTSASSLSSGPLASATTTTAALQSTPATTTIASSLTSHSDSNEVFGLMDLCPSCAKLAHQLTAIELERLSHIGPEEFVQAFAKDYSQNISATTATGQASSSINNQNNALHHSSNNKSDNHQSGNAMSSSTLNDMKKTRNLESYVEWFNRLSYLTASEIVKYPKKKQRVRIIEYWIETARECFNIGNFNSLMAIIAGLNLAPISRLKKTWSKVQSAKFSVLEHQMDPTSNFNSYRSTLKAAMWRSEGATEERERIIIPFFSLFVKDLYFLNEGCSNRLPNNHINYEKCSQLAKQVMEFNEWKKVQCPFEKLPNVIQYLQTCPILNENTLSMASFECEPPENTEEKGRYKTVKAETKLQLLQQLQDQQHQLQQPH